jgi:5-methylthioribose kinase
MTISTLSKRDRFYETAPKVAFFLGLNKEELEGYLWGRRWLETGECVLSGAVAGQGNMNYIVRVTTNKRTFILKQSRPWVERYPDITAPFDRAMVEAEFYRSISHTGAALYMPKFHWVDEESRILCLEDLGPLGDFTNVYDGVSIGRRELEQLCLFLSFLHGLHSQLPNREMKALNHFHIFVFPFEEENGLDLERFTPGLEALAQTVKRNELLRRRTAELGELYLAEGGFLVHGDCFPGSWLRVTAGVKVIDPEFAFGGPREFDLGVMLAHLLIAGMRDPEEGLRSYHYWKDLDKGLMRRFAGVEVLRRLFGVAQLPIRFDLDRKQALINEAVQLVVT